MKIDTLKDLERVIKLCRKTGVSAIKIDGIEFGLGPEPKQQMSANHLVADIVETGPTMPIYTPGGIDENTKITTDGLTEEQLLYYSSQGPTDETQPN